VVNVKRFGRSYVLYQCGTPDPVSLPPGAAPGVNQGMSSFEIPLYSVAVTDTTVNGFLVCEKYSVGGGRFDGCVEQGSRWAATCLRRIVRLTAHTTNQHLQSELNLIDRVALASQYSVDNCFQRLVDTKSQDGAFMVGVDGLGCHATGTERAVA